MANHLTPSELADEMRLERREVVARCVEMGVPILNGRVDKTLFRLNLERMLKGSEGSERAA